MRFRFRGAEYEAPDKFSFAEIEHVETKCGKPIDDWSSMTQMRASFYLALRRADLQAGRPIGSTLSWQALGELGPDDFDLIDEEPPPSQEPDGQDAGAAGDGVAGGGPDPTPAAAVPAALAVETEDEAGLVL